MGSNWKTYTLGELTKWSSGGTPRKLERSFWDGDIPWISASSMEGHIYCDSKHKITKEGLESGSKLALKNSLLLLVRGSILHQKIQVGLSGRNVAFNQDVKCLVPDENLIDPWFLLLWFKSKENELLSMVENTGIGAGKLDTKQLQQLPVQVPPPRELEFICTLGKAMFDRTTLNTKINQTLEEMAQAIFKSWFVDFDPVKAKMNGEQPKGMDADTASLFPEKLVESELGLIPDGWDINYIKDFGKVITGKTPPKKVEDAYAEEGVPFVTPSDIDSDVFVSETKRFLSESGVEAVKKSLLPEGSICVTCIGSQMGKAVISPSEAISNQQINSVVVAKDYERNFLFLNLRSRREEIFLIGSSGSTMPIINKSTFEKLAVLTPSEELMHSFDRAVSSLLSKIHQNAIENQTLSSLRDTLLPKLLSGEIDLESVQVEAVKAIAE